MISPFTDFTGNSTDNYKPVFTPANALEFEGPFVNNILNAADENFYTKEEDFEKEPPFINEMEEELSALQLKKAVESNWRSAEKYGWKNYVKQIVGAMGITTDDWIRNSEEENMEAFTKIFADWQDRHGFKKDAGYFGLGSWSYFQKKLGLHSLSNRHNIDVAKAIKDNSYYENHNWKGENGNIYTILAANKIIKEPLILSDENFAYAIADFQAIKSFYVDGILGPKTWANMKIISQGGSSATGQLPANAVPLSRWHSVVKGGVPSKTEILVDGIETFIRMNEAIRAVKEGGFIYILGWMLDIDFKLPAMTAKDHASLYDLLFDAAVHKKIEVRILIWKNPFYLSEIQHAEQKINAIPGNVKCFIDGATFGSPVVKSALSVLRSGISNLPFVVGKGLQFFDKWKEFIRYTGQQNEGSHHEKILITGDSENLTAFCGGVDINPDRRNELHDTHCRLEGHAAWELWRKFVNRWEAFLLSRGITPNSPGVNLMNGKKILPPPASSGKNVAYAKVLHTYNHWNGSVKDRSIRNTLRDVIFNAKRYVYFEDQYMVSCEIAGWLNDRLINVPGFKVIIATQNDEYAQSDLHFAKRKRAEFLAKLMHNIPDPSKVIVNQLSNTATSGIHRKMHSKVYIVDGELMVIGSANCNRRSMFNDSETAVFLFKHETSGYNLVKEWDDKVGAFDSRVNVYPYAKNPDKNIDDIDRKIYDEVKNAGTYLAVVNPTISVLTKMNLDALLRPLFEKFWEVIDPNPDSITCTLPSFIASEYEDEKDQNENFNFLQLNENPLAPPTNLKFSPATASFFSPEVNTDKTKKNAYSLSKSGVTVAAITAALSQTIDLGFIQLFLTDMNTRATGVKYQIDASYTTFDAVLTEAIHQFQISNFLNPKEHDGILGQSTIETLGIFDHGLKSRLNSAGFYGQSQLNRRDIKPQVSTLTGNEFTSANWYQGIIKPAWLGVKISDGIHILLFKKLKEAEAWLATQPQYQGLSPAKLGEAIGFTADTSFSGARLSSAKQAMHGFGLALDINVNGNPWIGAGWVKNDAELLKERTRILTALKNAGGGTTLPGSNVFEYLHSIAQLHGNDTKQAYDTLKIRNNEFVNYIKNNAAELSYWRRSQSFGGRNPLNGFLNLHTDLVYALRQVAGLAWGAIDFGPRASGDIMHFDLRTIGIGKLICGKIGGFVPSSGHPAITKEVFSDEGMYQQLDDEEFADESTFDEAIENEEWEDYGYTEEETKRSFTQYSQNAANIFLTITAEKQGQIKGNILQKGKEGMIAVYAFHHEITSPRDAASGMATGKRIHKPLVITKEVDLSSAKLLSALVTNERLKQVIINFWHPGTIGSTKGMGLEVNYYRVTITNAFISSITQDRTTNAEMIAPVLERVEFVYEKIEWQYLEGSNLTAVDDWRQMKETEFHEAIEEAASDENEMMGEWEREDQEQDEIHTAENESEEQLMEMEEYAEHELITDNYFENFVAKITLPDVRKRIDDYFDKANHEYKTDKGAMVKARSQFRISNGGSLLSEDAKTKVKKALAGKSCGISSLQIHNAAYGRAKPEDVAKVTQCLINAGELAKLRDKNTSLKDEELIRLLQREFGIGIDCGGYVQLAFIFAFTGSDNDTATIRNNLGLKERRGDENLGSLPAKHFEKIDKLNAQTGDLIIMKPRANDDGSIHTVIIAEHTKSGDIHKYLVDASWGFLYGANASGISRRVFEFDASTSEWSDIHPINGNKVFTNSIGPYKGHPINGVYRARRK